MTYDGIFIRQTLGQKPTDLSQGSCNSPDIIFDGQSDGGPGYWEDQANYGTASAADVFFNTQNYVYLRGYQANTTSGTNMWLYTVPCSLALWPANWSPNNITVYGSQGQNNHAWAPPQSGGNPLVVNTNALVWTPPTTNDQHYCAIAWADNATEANPQPPPFDQWTNLNSFDDLMMLLASNPNMGWRNTVSHPQAPPNNQYTSALATLDNPETWYITVNLNNIPNDGTFYVNVTGDITYASGALTTGNYLGGYQVNQGNGLPMQANQNAELIVTYFPGATQPSQYASITAELDHYLTNATRDALVRLAVPSTTLPIQQVVTRSGTLRQKVLIGRTEHILAWGTGGS